MMASVRVYQPRKNAMQSGRAKTKHWLVEFEPGSPLRNDSLMGWVGQGDTRNQLRLKFESREEAIAYCEKEGLDFQIVEPKTRTPKHKSYADNFRHNRAKNWTH